LHLSYPRATGFASIRRVRFSPFPSSSTSKSTHHRHHPCRLEVSPCRRRSGYISLPLGQPPTSPGARRSGTRVAAAVEAVHPPEHRRPSSPFSLFARLEEKKKQKKEGGRRKRKEEETNN
ncbi:Os05g0243900, partial [Oryza sativa Japonica Group]